MSVYDYQCSDCEEIQEVVHSMNDTPRIYCQNCDAICYKLLSLPHTHKDRLYSFVDVDTTGKPIQFNSKGQWKSHLKSKGLTDDIPQSAPKMNELKPLRNQKSKEQKRKEYQDVAVKVLKENKVI